MKAIANQELVLAVHPFLSSEEVKEKFTPLANYLSKETGLKITVRVGSSYDEHIEFVGQDKIDFAYMGPASYVKMTSKYGKKPVLSKLEVNGRSYFQGNIVVHQNSDIKDLQDLKGRNIAYGDPNSTMSYIVPHYILHKAGVYSDKTLKHQFLHSHTNVAFGVLSGDFDAGAVKPTVFKKFKKDGLRIIATTPKISEHLFVTRSNLGDKKVRLLRKAMLDAHKSQEGMAALKVIKGSISRLAKASDKDYDNLRTIIEESGHLH